MPEDPLDEHLNRLCSLAVDRLNERVVRFGVEGGLIPHEVEGLARLPFDRIRHQRIVPALG
jgi:hypothetical protein